MKTRGDEGSRDRSARGAPTLEARGVEVRCKGFGYERLQSDILAIEEDI